MTSIDSMLHGFLIMLQLIALQVGTSWLGRFSLFECLFLQVTTIRSRGRRPEIPLLTDPVHYLDAVGKQTVAKLKDMQAAARSLPNAQDVTLQDLTSQMRVINTGTCFVVC